MDHDHRVRHLPRPVYVCLLRLRTYGRADALVLAVSLGVYALNELVAKPLLLGHAAGSGIEPGAAAAIALLLKNHFNDFLGGVAFLAYVNLLFALVKPDRMIRRAAPRSHSSSVARCSGNTPLPCSCLAASAIRSIC